MIAARRDASWFVKPGRSNGAYHIVNDKGTMACRPRFPVFRESSIPADEVPKNMRCGRPGCRNRW